MQQVTRLHTQHKDLLHDISWDYYGNRLCTCSSDQKIKVWDKHPDSPSLLLNDAWQAHDCSVLKVQWAHPQYGQVVASTSFDKTVKIWEEQEYITKQSGKRWQEKTRMIDSHCTVLDLEFAPHHLGLWLATVAEDGMVRLYEAKEATNVAQWTLMHEFEAAGSAKKPDEDSRAPGNLVMGNESFCLSWCRSRFRRPMLAVGCGVKGIIRIFHQDIQQNWQPREAIEVSTVIHDLSWAPNLGRSYQLLAAGGKDHRVRIWKLKETSKSTDIASGDEDVAEDVGYSHQEVANFVDHNAEVWRVCWNLTGTMLASSGDDGKVRLWKGIIHAEHAGPMMGYYNDDQ